MENISSDIYILSEIFEYLNLKELLVAAKVCTRFKTAITKFLQWKYKEIEAFKTHHHYIITNKIEKEFDLNNTLIRKKRENRMLLSHKDFLDFLHINSNNIETLVLHLNADYEDFGYKSYYQDKKYLKNYPFKTLKKLVLERTKLTAAELYLIIEVCPNLIEINIRVFLDENEELDETAWIDEIPIATLDNRKLIKCFKYANLFLIDGYCTHREDNFLHFEHIEDLLTTQTTNAIKLKIESNPSCLNLRTTLVQSTLCESFIFGQFIQQNNFREFYHINICKFINLKQLTIVATPSVNTFKDLFVALNNNCKNLEYLELEYCTVKEFVPLCTLKELHLNNCSGLSWNDLKLILSQPMQLNTFTSTCIEYDGQYEYFDISEQLQHLAFRHCVLGNKSMSLNFKNLTSLYWSSPVLTKQKWISALNFPALQILEVRSSHLIVENLCDFKSLKKLVLNVSEVLNAQEFFLILQHPSLISLSFNDDPQKNCLNYKNYLAALKEKSEVIGTNLQLIDVCFNDSCYYFDFLCKLFASKFNLTLRIQYNCLQANFFNEDSCYKILSNIVSYKNQLSRLKSVNVCGYNIGLNKLKDDFNEAFEEAKLVSQDNQFYKKTQYVLLENNMN